LLGLEHPHSCAPYCHTGLRICLYISSLLFIVICDLRSINYDRFLLLISSSSFFFFICGFHFSLTSRFIPRYLASLTIGIGCPFISSWIFFYFAYRWNWCVLTFADLAKHIFLLTWWTSRYLTTA
jgi:hypothetical protein